MSKQDSHISADFLAEKVQSYVELYFKSRKDYFDTRIDAAMTESTMHYVEAQKAHDTMFTYLTARFEAMDKAILLLNEKNHDKFETIEEDVASIAATYARQESLEKASTLAKESVEVRFSGLRREVDFTNAAMLQKFADAQRERDNNQAALKDTVDHLMQIIEQSSVSAKERVEIAMKQTEAHVTAQAQATALAAQTVDLRFSGIDKSTSIANASLDKRLESMNDFRDQLKDQASRFVTREETEAKIKTFDPIVLSVQSRLGELEQHRANTEGRVWAFGTVITIVSIGVSVGLHFIK